MNRNKPNDYRIKSKKGKVKSIYTKFGWYGLLIAILVMFYVGIKYYNSDNEFERLFGLVGIMEGIFALAGLFLPDMIIYRRFTFKPESNEFMPFELKTEGSNMIYNNIGVQTLFIVFITLLIHFIFAFTPITIQYYDMVLAYAFAGFSEEAIFRGLIMGGFIKLAESFPNMTRYKLTKKRSITLLEVMGILLSSVLFMSIHFNYYEYPEVMLATFFSGVAHAFFFWLFRNITANMFAHFGLNLYWIVANASLFVVNV